jgi:glycosyltransferase involved in cell wall biosynthesis
MPRIALVHDYFTQQGGAERVAEELYLTLNRPDVFTTALLPQHVPPAMRSAKIYTSWMQRLPRMQQLSRLYFPLYPAGVATLNLSKYDVVVSSSSSYAKGVHTSPSAVHICYCHTPTRWIWRYHDYAEREKFNLAARIALPVLLSGLKIWDTRAAQRPDHFIANSRNVAGRIAAAYNRTATVIPPPIQDDYYLVLSRLVGYKKLDVAIRACTKLNRRLLIIGDGVDRNRLQGLAGPTVKFLGRLPDEEVARYASHCRALIFPGEEDFGMAPLELAAAGRPTIAFAGGGATETIIDGETGCFFAHQHEQSLADAVIKFETLRWDPSLLRQHAAKFDVTVFRNRIYALLQSYGLTLSTDTRLPDEYTYGDRPTHSAVPATGT